MGVGTYLKAGVSHFVITLAIMIVTSILFIILGSATGKKMEDAKKPSSLSGTAMLVGLLGAFVVYFGVSGLLMPRLGKWVLE